MPLPHYVRGARQRAVQLLRWLWSPTARPSPKMNSSCPICGTPVAIAPTMTGGGGYSGLMFSPATSEERIAACLTHGRPPLNDATRSASQS